MYERKKTTNNRARTQRADRCVCPKAIVRVIMKERLRLKDLECIGLSVYYSVVLNLYTVIVYSFCSLSLLTFCRAKSYKNARHTEKQPFAPSVCELLCNITQPSQTSHYNPFCFEQGATNNIANELKPNLFEFLQRVQHIEGFPKLAPRGCIRKITPTLRSNILAQWPALNRDLRYVFNGAGFLDITCADEFPRTMATTVGTRHAVSERKHNRTQQRADTPVCPYKTQETKKYKRADLAQREHPL